jgi:hypothetical protein
MFSNISFATPVSQSPLIFRRFFSSIFHSETSINCNMNMMMLIIDVNSTTQARLRMQNLSTQDDPLTQSSSLSGYVIIIVIILQFTTSYYLSLYSHCERFSLESYTAVMQQLLNNTLTVVTAIFYCLKFILLIQKLPQAERNSGELRNNNSNQQ